MLHFDIDDNGSDGMGVEIYCDHAGESLVDKPFIGIELYSDSGNGTCYFEDKNIDKLIAAFKEIEKELRPQNLEASANNSQQTNAETAE